jgi:hypothetical protein
MERFLLLSDDDGPSYPHDGRCPACGKPFTHGLAYLSAGALLLSEDGCDSVQTNKLRGFLNLGYHGTDPDMTDSADAGVVDDLFGGQFDLKWCSVACMKKWLLDLLDEVERQASLGGRDQGRGPVP